MSDFLDTAKFVLMAGAALWFLYLAFRFGGLKGLLGAVAALGVLFIYRKGRDDGHQNQIEKGREDASIAVNEANRARVDAAVRDSDPSELRQSDGFRRD